MQYTYKLPKPRKVPCNGTSIWGDTSKVAPTVKSITFSHEFSGGFEYMNIWVNHNSRRWWIYTDSGFEKNISQIVTKVVGKPVKIIFTEQGMQRERRASMEGNSPTDDRKILQWMWQKRGK